MSNCGKPTKRTDRRAKRQVYRINNKYVRLQNYLEENGANLVKYNYDYAYYERTPQLLSLLDSYWIKYTCIPNRA